MYGVEFRARLNDGNSALSGFGWGYLNPSTNYLGVNDVKVEGENLHPDWG
jgi:hypothetical protein